MNHAASATSIVTSVLGMSKGTQSHSPEQEEAHLRVMRTIEAKPSLSQRELAQELGISLGKTNYCLRALLEKGWIKARNFKNSNNKMAYSYLLTPKGVDQKAKLTLSFLKRKQAEYRALEREIEELVRESAATSSIFKDRD